MGRTIEACLICSQPLVYFQTPQHLTCHICGKDYETLTSCENGHFVCDACHSRRGLEVIKELCLHSESRNPIQIMQEIMENQYLYMHGPEHHTLVGAALLTAYYHAGGDIYLPKALGDLMSRGKDVPGGICGFWGCCGAAVSTGIFVSIITGTTPLSAKTWGLANQMTAQALEAIGRLGGPRCCKRNSFTAVKASIPFIREHFGIALEDTERITCCFQRENKECLGRQCPYFPS